ncbi:TIGR03279 family radical SAM protein [Planktothrix sp. FACHB-1355]|uniref:TIGR03279 family radical SAM protein n=1 Tax=Aerosakkonema funiforme FACHB-1375 TaxID=2949571 RepID=A0A926VJ46_9CYAN|nr:MULTISPECIES: TIGR03279 family radical SAM protein [Oscillatoriales]MBD2183642.1 TIGR03279 family radical SAM protein [Aerosakkonema funiforme FACHB-1375]MBD3560749.1 TIGR03279 family radical SAM protein [Planktothrix sp. FACHB-1355]
MSETSISPALITKVIPNSIAAEIGFEAGDRIVSINGDRPRDLIDYKFLCADEFLELEILDAKGKTHHIEIEKDYDEDLGLEFETALFDGLIQCNNRCPFCFIDQQPPGKRKSLYLKDDDYRLSFLYGSYLTLTNLTQKEWNRIEQMRLSPLYVSVHATEPEVRIRLLKNPRAGQILEQLNWFKKRRLQIHAQVVVCPGINDSIHLETTLRDLAKFHKGEIPAVASVAVVPVGLTRFRPAEDELTPVTPEKAREVISQVQKLQAELRKKNGTNCVWLADEWFLIAGEELPPESHYEEYPQIDNGVGSIRLFLRKFELAAQKLPLQVSPQRKFTWVVGNAVELAFQPILQRLNQVEGLQVNMAAFPSRYWGQSITVTGLLTGQDLLENLQGKDLGDGILLPALMLKHGDTKFLDDMTVEELADKLGTKILPVSGVEGLIESCVGYGAGRMPTPQEAGKMPAPQE